MQIIDNNYVVNEFWLLYSVCKKRNCASHSGVIMNNIRWIAMLGICCLSVPTFSVENIATGSANATAPETTATAETTAPGSAAANTAMTNTEFAVPAPPDINAPVANDGSTALHEAAQFNRLDEVKLLLEKGADINAVNSVGLTPLHLAARSGHTDMVALLLARKADVMAKDIFGLTSLHLAAQYGHENTMYLLIANGAVIESRTNTQGMTPLHWAAFSGHIEGIKCLLSSGADINARDNTGNTPLTWAEAYGQHDMARLLARKGGKGHIQEKVSGLNASWHID